MKRYIAVLLMLVLLITLVPNAALAESSSLASSEELKETIKQYEGCVLTAYKAHSSEEHWTIGYGHYGPDVTEGMTITKEQAEAYFEQDIIQFEDAVNGWNDKYELELNQNEFDALVSVTYNFGTHWVEYYSGWRLSKYLKGGFNVPDLELADAFGVLCNAGGEILPGLISRRINEVEIFLYGDYDMENTHFVYTLLDANGGSLTSGNRVAIYAKDKPYGTMPAAKRDGYTHYHWTDAETGRSILPSTIADTHRTLKAVWSSDGGCQYGGDCPSKSFTDVSLKYWAHDDIDYAVSVGLFNGMSPTAFGPTVAMTRGMLVTVLYRLEGSPDVSDYENPFTDLKENSYCYEAILWGSNARISNGFNDGSFKPDETLTREQLVTFMHRYANYKNYNTDIYAELGTFTDAQDIMPYARQSMSWAIGAGLVNGLTPTTVVPQGSAQRDQVAAIFHRFAGSMV